MKEDILSERERLAFLEACHRVYQRFTDLGLEIDNTLLEQLVQTVILALRRNGVEQQGQKAG